MADTTGLLLLAAGAWVYMHSRAKVTIEEAPEMPNAQREVDLNRWRHDGSQPLFWTKGNAESIIDETSQYIHAKLP